MSNIPPMKTGFSNLIEPTQNVLCKVNALLMTLIEKAFIGAAFYAKHAERDTVTPGDIKIALMYEAHEFWNHDDIEEKVEEFETEDSDSSCSDSSQIEEVEDVEFSRAVSCDPKIVSMNNYFDTWDSWEPTDQTTLALKNAIDKQF